MRLKPSPLWASKNKRQRAWLLAGLFAAGAAAFILPSEAAAPVFWEVRSIDTVKYSRDVSREKLADASFDEVIDRQVASIAAAGATHVAIGTPYDEEFWPMLERWVAAARRHGLQVWFRGNWSGWEGWFGYPTLGRAEHIRKTRELIAGHRSWFRDGDIFTACTECENGGPGDPRRTGDVAGHRQFLIKEYEATRQAFAAIDRKVASNYNSMNGDVARLIMDQETTAALGGVVTVDHYVATPEKLAADLAALHEHSGGQIVLGEFGVPIPDIHGAMSQREQARWLAEALQELAQLPYLVGVNYWLAVGGSTQLWDEDGTARPAAEVLHSYYKPVLISGVVRDELGRALPAVSVQSAYNRTRTDGRGDWRLPHPRQERAQIDFSAAGYADQRIWLQETQTNAAITLVKLEKGIVWRIFQALHLFVSRVLAGGLVL